MDKQQIVAELGRIQDLVVLGTDPGVTSDALRRLRLAISGGIAPESGKPCAPAGEAPAAEFPSCTLKSLPDDLLHDAAATATEENPANHPPVAALAGLVGEAPVDLPLAIAVMTTKYWGSSTRTFSVRFLDNPTAALRSKILGHMNAWECGIDFKETFGQGEVRLSRDREGYWSFLGTDILHIGADEPTMNLQGFTELTPEGEFFRVVRHEVAHTLGAPHEHMRRELIARIDPARAIAYFGQTQGWSAAMVRAQVLTPLDQRSLYGTPADQTSIMAYQLPSSITRDGRPIVGGTDISATDRAFMQRIYPPAAPAQDYGLGDLAAEMQRLADRMKAAGMTGIS